MIPPALLWQDQLDFENFIQKLALIQRRESSPDTDLDLYRMREIKRHLEALVKRREVQYLKAVGIKNTDSVRLRVIKDLSELDSE